ncbi:MAG: lytic transglycosylase domain-containing protein [Actinomycetota bacterium]|nr:lytic transglycosylase domain-containing protein [Actinomycetota bacterium]
MRSGKSRRTGGVRPITALALVALCMAATTQTSSPDALEVTAARPVVAPPPPTATTANAAGFTTEPLVTGFPTSATEAQRMPIVPPTVLPVVFTTKANGVPENVIAAYQRAETLLALTQPGCGVRWYHLAGIGRIESGHARGGRADAAGNTAPHILGPVLAGGPGIAAIRDTDGGALDGDTVWDRAVGSMQFIPSTWAHYGTDGNNDRIISPHNIFDASAAAGRYLCSGGMNLADPGDLNAAVYRYNHSTEYVSTVLSWMNTYSSGATPTVSTPTGAWDDSEITATPLIPTRPTKPAQHAVTQAPPPPPAPQPTLPPVPAPAPDPIPLPEPEQPSGTLFPVVKPPVEVPTVPSDNPVEDGVVPAVDCGPLADEPSIIDDEELIALICARLQEMGIEPMYAAGDLTERPQIKNQ